MERLVIVLIGGWVQEYYRDACNEVNRIDRRIEYGLYIRDIPIIYLYTPPRGSLTDFRAFSGSPVYFPISRHYSASNGNKALHDSKNLGTRLQLESNMVHTRPTKLPNSQCSLKRLAFLDA